MLVSCLLYRSEQAGSNGQPHLGNMNNMMPLAVAADVAGDNDDDGDDDMIRWLSTLSSHTASILKPLIRLSSFVELFKKIREINLSLVGINMNKAYGNGNI